VKKEKLFLIGQQLSSILHMIIQTNTKVVFGIQIPKTILVFLVSHNSFFGFLILMSSNWSYIHVEKQYIKLEKEGSNVVLLSLKSFLYK